MYQMRCTAYKVAPDDGLIQSETCRASNHKNFVHLVGLYTYCKDDARCIQYQTSCFI